MRNGIIMASPSVLESQLHAANFELQNSRKLVVTLKEKCNHMEDQVVDYRAEVGKWKTLAQQRGLNLPQQQDTSAIQQQLDMTCRQLTAVTREKDELSQQIALIQERDLHTMTQQHTVQNEVIRTQVQGVQIENNTLRYRIQEKDVDIRKMVEELQATRANNNRLSHQMRLKEDEVEGLTMQLKNTSILSPPHSPPSQHEAERLQRDNEKLVNEKQRLFDENKELHDKNIFLHQQNMMYEEDFKKELREKETMERKLAQIKDENKTLQTVIDTLNRDGRVGGVVQ